MKVSQGISIRPVYLLGNRIRRKGTIKPIFCPSQNKNCSNDRLSPASSLSEEEKDATSHQPVHLIGAVLAFFAMDYSSLWHYPKLSSYFLNPLTILSIFIIKKESLIQKTNLFKYGYWDKKGAAGQKIA
jgi:hypothetical protein